MNILRRFYGPAVVVLNACALLIAVQIPQAVAEPVGYEGTATLCFVSTTPPIVEEKRNKTLVEGVVSVYLIETDHPLVSGWEVLDLDWKITKHWTFINGEGVLVPYGYEGTDTALVENVQIKSKDLSTMIGEWQGSGELLGTTVEYELIPQAEPVPVCDYSAPPAVCGDIGGCFPAKPPYVADPIVYDLSGWVDAPALPLSGVTLEGSGIFPIVPSSAIVGPGIEFYMTDPWSNELFSIDFDESGFVTVTNLIGLHVIYGDLPATFTVTSSPAETITGFELGTVSGVTGITQTDLAFDEISVSTQLGMDTRWEIGGAFSAQMLFLPDNFQE